MATPSRAPRRTAAQMNVNIAQGTPLPGVNTPSTYTRTTAKASDGGAYNKQRSDGKSGVSPNGFPDTKVNK